MAMLHTPFSSFLVGLGAILATPPALASTAEGIPGSHRSAIFYMFTLVASLLFLFFVVIALSAAMRLARRYRAPSIPHQRGKSKLRANPESEKNKDLLDPWAEAGRRLGEDEEE